MPSLAEILVQQSLFNVRKQNEDALTGLYDRLSDHYHGDVLGDAYFPKRWAETQKRYENRPRRAVFLCASAVDVLTGAMIGDGVDVEIGAESANKVYQELVAANGLADDHALLLATQASVYGWTLNRIMPTMMPVAKAAEIEFEAVEPIYWRPIYDRSTIGRSVDKILGVRFLSYWDPGEKAVIPWSEAGGDRKIFERVEIVTADAWQVYIDDQPTPRDPRTGELWVPREDGRNPWGVLPVSFLWNQRQMGALEGKSDIDPAHQTAEDINQLYSQILELATWYFPTLAVPQGTGDQAKQIEMGMGLGLSFDRDGQMPGFIVPPVVLDNLMSPFRNLVTIFFSQVATPSSSHGLGGLFNEGAAAESGRAKFYEFHRLTQRIKKKRRFYEAFRRDEYRALAAVLKLPPEAPVSFNWRTPIVPISDEEVLDRLVKEIENSLRSHLEAIMQLRGIPDTKEGREQAQAIIDEIARVAGQVQPETPVERTLREQFEKE